MTTTTNIQHIAAKESQSTNIKVSWWKEYGIFCQFCVYARVFACFFFRGDRSFFRALWSSSSFIPSNMRLACTTRRIHINWLRYGMFASSIMCSLSQASMPQYWQNIFFTSRKFPCMFHDGYVKAIGRRLELIARWNIEENMGHVESRILNSICADIIISPYKYNILFSLASHMEPIGHAYFSAHYEYIQLYWFMIAMNKFLNL